MPLPVNFEKLVKLPPSNGYPHAIRASDLMRNFAYCDLLPGSELDSENGLWIELESTEGVTSNHPQRQMVVRGNVSGAPELPFTAKYDAASGLMSLLGGYYQVGATGAWVEIPATAPTTGTLAYLVFIQTPTGELDEDGAEILITDTPLDPYTAIEEEETSFAVAVPIAEVSGERVIQRRHGNFTLGLWQIDGDVIRWPETVAGSIPPTP
jgi:hypothetical protein